MPEIAHPFVPSATRTASLLRDYAELTKARITALIVATAWSGYFFGAHRAGASALSVGLIHALLGVGLVSSGTAALNEVLEVSLDERMRRTARRPLPAVRMTRTHGGGAVPSFVRNGASTFAGDGGRVQTASRRLLRATILYLPLLFALMMANSVT